MAILTATHISQSFGAVDLFRGVSGSIPRGGKVGLVGPNGIGKTTLLLILAGISQPAAGKVTVARGTSIGYLPQESSDAFADNTLTVYEEMLTVFAEVRAMESRLRRLEAEMAQGDPDEDLLEQYSKRQMEFELGGGYEYPLRIRQVLSGLGFDEEAGELPLHHLSGGQKTRALLARLLLEAPDLLILDEPTNHLDVAAVQWLEGTLKIWDGALLVVSHDRYFLDTVVDTIWEMRHDGLETFRGNYSAYVQQRQMRWEQKNQAYDDFVSRLAKEVDFIKRNIAGQRTQMAQGKLSRVAREVEAVRVGGLSVLEQLDSKGWLQVSTTLDLRRPARSVGELEQAIGQLRPPQQPATLNMRLRPSHRSGNIVLRTKDLVIGYPGHPPLFTAADVELHRTECAALIGGNGTGKTTLLRTIIGELSPLSGEIKLGASLKIGYFSQTQENLNPDNRVLDELLQHRNMKISEARSYLGRYMFSGDDVFKRVASLSGGERNRLALSLLVLENANFLLLDEPTNHLDIPAQEVLQAAIESFGGTVLLVSHDRYLVDRLGTQIWDLRNGRLHVYAGSYQNYLAQRHQETETERAATAAARAENEDDAEEESAGLSKNEQRRLNAALAALEEEITHVEKRLEEITREIEIATQTDAFDKIQSLSLEYADRERELEELLTKWETLHE